MLIKTFSSFVLWFVILAAFASQCHADDAIKYGAALSVWQDLKQNAFDRNSKTLQDENAFRFKMYFWSRWDYSPNFGGFLKLGSEAFYTAYSYNPDKHGLQWDELGFENLYLDVKNILSLPVDMRIGRQEMMYGDGLLIADGTPSDRERTSYFNAVKTTWRFAQQNSIDLVYINDPKTDDFLPTLRSGANSGSSYLDHKRLLTASDEQGVILYGRNSLPHGLNIEPYYIYKREESIAASGKGAVTPTLDLHTIGARAVYGTTPWKITGEFAHQFGEYAGGKERTGYGGNVFIKHTFVDTFCKPELEAGYVYLSGDKSQTTANEGWNPLFSRWNRLSKFYSSSFTSETGLASYWTNMQHYRATMKLNFVPGTNLSLSYNYLLANETTNVTGSAASYFSNNGKERGHLAQTRLNFKLSRNVEGYLAYEYFFPGDFYKLKASESIMTWRLIFKLGSEKLKMNGDQVM